MSKSLQDQLLNAGVIDKKKAKKVNKEQRKERKQKIDSSQQMNDSIKQAQKEKQERDKALNLKRKEEADQKAVFAQVAQIVDHYKLTNTKGELEYNFSHNNVIKKLRLNQETLDHIAKGRLSIVSIKEEYYIIPKPVAEKIRAREESALVMFDSTVNQSSTKSEDDDYYAQFEIPDDLMW